MLYTQYLLMKRILKAFTYSYDGFKSAFKSEPAFRQDLFLCAIFFILSFFIPVTAIEKLLLISSLILILLMELANTAIETVINRISKGYNDLSKKAKDIGSLLVLISFINATITWTVILKNILLTV